MDQSNNKNMKADVVYLSSGVNQTKKCLDWNQCLNLVAYAASNRIVLYGPKSRAIVGVSLQSHGPRINCVQWIKGQSNKNYLLSTSTDGSTNIWIYEDKEEGESVHHGRIKGLLKVLTTLQVPVVGSKQNNISVSCGYGLMLASSCKVLEDEMFVVTAGDDFFIRGWRVNIETGEFEETFIYKLPGRSLVLDLIIIHSTQSERGKHWPLVVYGGDDGSVHVLSSKCGRDYTEATKLSGHHDWITSLSYCNENDGNILLSSGSKDGIIRLWRISHFLKDAIREKKILQTKSLEIKVWQVARAPDGENKSFSLFCSLESVMQGHDGLLSHLDWYVDEGKSINLLSCSKTEDRSIVVWEPQADISSNDAAIWVEKTRLGEIGGNREGFFNAKFSPCGNIIVAVSYQGGLHMWHFLNGSWVPQSVVSGHFDEVVDLDWDKKGRYLLTVSKDQTTRLHSELQDGVDKVKWQEIARPQVHGYDMTCVACLDLFKFASGGEEKVIRGFTATKNFVRRIEAIGAWSESFDICSLELPEMALVPSLGLSNKAEEQTPSEGNDTVPNGFDVADIKQGPPTEDELMLGTLWSEVSKLYGHGNEMLALASSNDGSLLASSCRTNVDLDAKVIIWDTREWKEKFSLCYHRLTVTQIEFSTCDKFLLTVSRDRTWAVHRKDEENGFTLAAHSGAIPKKLNHTRIIWSCAWVPHSRKFITGSRDTTWAIWIPVYHESEQPVAWEREFVCSETEEVVAVAVQRIPHQENIILIAIGCVDGSLLLKLYDEQQKQILKSLQVEISHRKSIRRLKFRPMDENDDNLILASCGSDNSVFLHRIIL